MAEAGEVRLASPAYSLTEPYEKRIREANADSHWRKTYRKCLERYGC